MGKDSKISWTQSSWNPFINCHKVSEGCKFCYSERLSERYGKDFNKIERTKDHTFYSPLKWKEPKMIFTCSLSDFFIEEGDQWRDEIWGIIKRTPQHTYQILTKRPERIIECLPKDWGISGGYENVWLGVSVENQKRADERIPILLDIPAKIRWISAEPLLNEINLSNYLYNRYIMDGARNMYNSIDWVIAGGESGHNARPCEVDWLKIIVSQCKVSHCKQGNVPIFVKQMGTQLAKKLKMKDWKGEDINEFPNYLKIRQYPNIQKSNVLI